VPNLRKAMETLGDASAIATKGFRSSMPFTRRRKRRAHHGRQVVKCSSQAAVQSESHIRRNRQQGVYYCSRTYYPATGVVTPRNPPTVSFCIVFVWNPKTETLQRRPCSLTALIGISSTRECASMHLGSPSRSLVMLLVV
jgi:hypothetical protein